MEEQNETSVSSAESSRQTAEPVVKRKSIIRRDQNWTARKRSQPTRNECDWIRRNWANSAGNEFATRR